MFSHFTPAQIIVAAVAVLFVVAIAVATYREKRKTKSLRTRFGSEYDRAVLQHGSSRKAEAKLAGRETRVDAFKIHELNASDRERFAAAWQTVQSRFVDFPKGSVTEADQLIAALLVARGYPRDTFEQSAADLSVDHPRMMVSYRAAHSIAERPPGSEASTEELRYAMIQSRAIFDELIQNPDHDQNPQEEKAVAA